MHVNKNHSVQNMHQNAKFKGGKLYVLFKNETVVEKLNILCISEHVVQYCLETSRT